MEFRPVPNAERKKMEYIVLVLTVIVLGNLVLETELNPNWFSSAPGTWSPRSRLDIARAGYIARAGDIA